MWIEYDDPVGVGDFVVTRGRVIPVADDGSALAATMEGDMHFAGVMLAVGGHIGIGHVAHAGPVRVDELVLVESNDFPAQCCRWRVQCAIYCAAMNPPEDRPEIEVWARSAA